MRIVAGPGDLEGCGTYRILLPYRALRTRGHDVTIMTRLSEPMLTKADVVVLQRQTSREAFHVAQRCRAAGVPVVYELDDNVHSLSPESPASKHYGSGRPATRMVERFFREADAITVSTQPLADAYRRYNANIFVCRNALDDRLFARVAPETVSGVPKRDGIIRIGWAGSFTHRADLRTVVPALTTVMREDERIQFVTIGDVFNELFPVDVRSRVLALYGRKTATQLDPNCIAESLLGIMQYYELTASAGFDVAIAPIEHTFFNECKSDLKLLEYGAFGIPAIATRFGPYARYQAESEREVVRLVRGHDEWESALRELVSSASRRRELAAANLDHVRRSHLLSQRIADWEEALVRVVSDHIASRRAPQVRRPSSASARRRARRAANREAPDLLISDAKTLSDALCELPTIAWAAEQAAAAGVTVGLSLTQPQVLDLLPKPMRSSIRLFTPGADELNLCELRSRCVWRLDGLENLRRYGRITHAMQAHLVARGYPPETFRLPDLRIPAQSEPTYDFVLAPFCADEPTGGLEWPLDRWQAFVDRIRAQQYRVCVIGERGRPSLDGGDSIIGDDLIEAAGVLAHARYGVITANNWVSHLTHLLRVRHLLLYPDSLSYAWQRNTNPNSLHLIAWIPHVPVEATLGALDVLRRLPIRLAA